MTIIMGLTHASGAIHLRGGEVTRLATTPWWNGVPTCLLRKTTLVPAGSDRLPVHTLTFAMPSKDSPIFHSGSKAVHPSTLNWDCGDVIKMVIPGYKPKSYSISDLRDQEFDITFKVYPNGRASGYLDRLQIQDEISTFGLSKHKIWNFPSTTKASTIAPTRTYVGIIAYGVGITEALPVTKALLTNYHSQCMVTLLWAARTRADTFWTEEIAQLQHQFPNTFTMQYIFSRDDDDPNSLKGRINANIIQQVFLDWKTRDDTTTSIRFLSVGTKEMMAQTDDLLASIGYSMPEYALLKSTKSGRDSM